PHERTGLVCLRARLLATVGDHDGARAALREVHDHPWPGVPVTEARLLLAADAAAAVDVLDEAEVRFACHPDSVAAVEMATLHAIAHDESGDAAAANRAVERALDCAERFGHRWPFIEAGRRMEALLRAQIRSGTAHRSVVGELLAAFEDRLPDRRLVAPL